MPPARDDLRLLLFAGGVVVFAGVVVAVLLAVSTGRSGSPPKDPQPVALGLESDYKDRLPDGPDFIPDHFGQDLSFWLTLEDGEVIAIAVDQSDLPNCSVNWKGQLDRFVCGDERFRSFELERFEVTVPAAGDDEGRVLVDVRRRLPAPALAAG